MFNKKQKDFLLGLLENLQFKTEQKEMFDTTAEIIKIVKETEDVESDN